MSDKGRDVDLTRAKQNTGVWLVKVGPLFVDLKKYDRLFIGTLYEMIQIEILKPCCFSPPDS